MPKILHGKVNLEDLTIYIQFHINDKCQLIKLPDYNITYSERESLGNGWYGNDKTKITKTVTNAYLVKHNNTFLGHIVNCTNNETYYLDKRDLKNKIKQIISCLNNQTY